MAAFDYSVQRDSLRYTDDGQMALVIFEYLAENATIVPDDLMLCFVQSYEPWRGYGRGARVLISKKPWPPPFGKVVIPIPLLP